MFYLGIVLFICKCRVVAVGFLFVCFIFFSFLSKCSLVCNMTIQKILIIGTDESWVKHRYILLYSDTIKKQLRDVFIRNKSLSYPEKVLTSAVIA